MSSTLQTVIPDIQESSSGTPVVLTSPPIPIIDPQDLLSTDAPSLAATLKLPDSSAQYLAPISPHKPAFVLADILDENGIEGILGSEVGSADVTVAGDGSFIETSSGSVAREIKKRYDTLFGVGVSVRSPYAITGFVNQHGRHMYRFSHRENTAPAAAAVDAEERIAQSKTNDPSNSPKAKRRSRLSIHFTQAMFPKPIVPVSRPPTATSTTYGSSRKLRKTRSIPDMFGAAPIVTNGPTFSATGRGHSQSVTAADLPRPSVPFSADSPERKIGYFGELMEWFTPASNVSSNYSSHNLFNPEMVSSDTAKPRATVAQPFGPAVIFSVPSQRPAVEHLPTPRHLRLMQSFDSSATARQIVSFDDNISEMDIPPLDDFNSPEDSASRPTSVIRLSILSSASPNHTEPETEEAILNEADTQLNVTPSAESLRLSSHYSTEVFNVLQTYRGLPLFEKLVPESGDDATVIKLSLANDQSATPRDDPRFVLWGELALDHEHEDQHSISRHSVNDSSLSSVSSSSVSKRRSSKVSKLKSPEHPTAKLPDIPAPRILLAATIERWIAQLTSDLNYDELLNFFLTYRTYVSGVDLCHLLICRFHWALQASVSVQDEVVRRIVRVRTFVAIRYWLLTFFTVDFIPNLELRQLMSDWLNTLVNDPILKKHSDATGIVRRLIKVAKECKRAHIRVEDKPKPNEVPKAPTDQSLEQLLGKSFAEATRKAPAEDEVSELDLGFLADDARPDESIHGFLSDPANAHLSAANTLGGNLSGSRPNSLPLSTLTILQRTDHAPGPTTTSDLQYIHNGTVQLGMKHSALSRAFVRTIGRLGRWKRVLNARGASRPASVVASNAGVSAFDLEVTAPQDLLTDTGVQRFLQLSDPLGKPALLPHVPISNPPINTITPAIPTPAILNISPTPPVPTTPPPVPGTHLNSTTPSLRLQDSSVLLAYAAESSELTPLSDINPTFLNGPDDAIPAQDASEHPVQPSVPVVEGTSTTEEPRGSDAQTEESISREDGEPPRETSRAYSFRSSSTDSFGAPLTSDGPVPPIFPGHHNQWHFNVVSIDDLDLSDTSSLPPEGPTYPPGLRRPPRRLPMRREFEFVRRSEVSSMGIISHESMRDSSASSHSERSPNSSGPKPIHKWQMKSLQQTFESMSDEEDGDVEAALRRLEGHINPKTQQEKAEKVDGWVRNLRERMENGDYDYESSLFSEDEVEGFIDEVDTPDTLDSADGSPLKGESYELDHDNAATPVPEQVMHHIQGPPGLIPVARKVSKPAIEDAVPIEILQSRMPSVMSSSSSTAPTLMEPAPLVKIDGPQYYKSFIVDYSSEMLARHFAMIDRELFMGVKFEELVSEDWIDCEEIEVLDWAQFLKDRARWKVEGRFAVKTTALAALRARFNLMVSFVVSEIALTAPAQRPHLVNRFVRLAWKSYGMSNFHTMTAVITALRNPFVQTAMRRPGWSRLGMFEKRVYDDLNALTSSKDDFKLMRGIVESIVDAKPIDSSNPAGSVVSGGDSQSGRGKVGAENLLPTSCIPFIGIYLSQLYRYNKLPAVIDPTAPHSLIGIDAESAIFDQPAHPEVFADLAPLPECMHLEPLINVHKQRKIAEVIKSLVAGQHFASRVHFDVDKRLFQRCLRLRGLNSTMLQRALDLSVN